MRDRQKDPGKKKQQKESEKDKPKKERKNTRLDNLSNKTDKKVRNSEYLHAVVSFRGL